MGNLDNDITEEEVVDDVDEDVVEEEELIEIDLTEDAIINDKVVNIPEEVVSTTTVAPVVAEEEEVTEEDEEPEIITTTLAPEEEDLGDGFELTVEEYDSINEIDTGDDKFFVSKQTAEAAQKYGYKILLKKVGADEIPVGKIKFSLPTVVEIQAVENPLVEEVVSAEPTTTIAPTEIITTPALVETTTAVVIAKAVEVITTADAITTTEANEEEDVTDPPEVYLPPPITSVIPTVEKIDEETIVDGVMAIKEETEKAIDEIMSSEPEGEEDLLLSECSASLVDVKEMLSSLALNIAQSTPILRDILATGESLKDITDLEELARGGARLLTLLEPFLDSLLPATQVADCAGDDSVNMLMGLTGVATKLDLLANEEEDQDKANELHQTATSLQLAAFVMAQLQKSVHTFYTPEGLCGEGKSSAVSILGALGKALFEYQPLLAMMGNEESVGDLAKTIESIESAKVEISSLEANSGLEELPGVECGASFTEMGQALQNLADFIQGLPQ